METGKQRAARIPLDYYRHGDALERWKMRLAGVALLATLGWLGASWALSGQDDFQSSPGPLAGVHQAWDSQCQACHEPFTSLSAQGAPFLGDPLESSRKCQSCHTGAIHHAGQTPQLACAACHHDHRGRDASLVNLPDRACVQCHSNLNMRHGTTAAAFANQVVSFSPEDHPRFRSLRMDPGKLAFNHRLHLTAGIALTDGGQVGGPLRTLGQIPPSMRERYRNLQQDQRDAALVQLQCASCHQADGEESRGSGAYMAPFTYDNHCRACHPLTVDHKLPDARFAQAEVPHHMQPREIRRLLDDHFTAKIARGFWEAPPQKDVPPLPGKNTPPLLPVSELDRARAATKSAEDYLYRGQAGCSLCHVISTIEKEYYVKPTDVPRVWLQHARFNHAAHRAVSCQECHAQAAASRLSSDVLIPNQDNCLKCHAPATAAGTPGVRSTCTTCHLYHNGDHSLEGLGSSRRGPRRTRTIMEFLLDKGER